MSVRETRLTAQPEEANRLETPARSQGAGRPGIGPAPRPRSLITPPPDPAEAMYYEGLAAYQHRNWAQALDRFSRLQELQPARPGLDALLDEVRWFLQLQAAAPQPAEDEANEAATWRPGIQPSGRGPARPRWQTALLLLMAAIGLSALALIATQGRMPWTTSSDRVVQELFNRGQARLAVGDYEGAQTAFKQLLDLTPNDGDAQLGLQRAIRQQTLAQGYAAAEAAIAEENWDLAAAELEKVLALDGAYANAQAKANFVSQRRRLATLYSDGSRLYDLGQWVEAIAQFEKIRELDTSYRKDAIIQFLFVCYVNAGQQLIDQADGKAASAQRAVEYFSTALALNPRNRQATDARRLASLYGEALRGLTNGNLADTQARLQVLLAEAPTYANGQAIQQLYTLLIARGEAALQTGDQQAAIGFFQAAQTVAVADHSAATEREAYARKITPTPTPPPAATLAPGGTPVATTTPYVVVRAGTLNLRGGPGTNYPILGQLAAARPTTVIGRTADGAWLRVCLTPIAADGSCPQEQTGWIAAALVDVFGVTEGLVVITPPAPPASASTPAPPETGQLVCVSGQVRDTAGGAPLAGWTITLQGQALGGGVKTARANSSGFYQFTSLTPGSYTITEQLETGWRAISPQASVVVVTPSAACVVVDFWNERGGSAPAAPTPPR